MREKSRVRYGELGVLDDCSFTIETKFTDEKIPYVLMTDNRTGQEFRFSSLQQANELSTALRRHAEQVRRRIAVLTEIEKRSASLSP